MSRGRSPLSKALLAAAVVLAALSTAAALYRAEVRVAVPTSSVETSVSLVGQPLETRALGRSTTATTGSRVATAATGVVVFSYGRRVGLGASCQDHPAGCPPPRIAVPAGTIVGTCPGGSMHPCNDLDIRFVTERAVEMGMTFSDRVPVRAVEPGTGGNVDNASVRGIEGYKVHPNAELTVDNLNSFSGGADERRGLVAPADVERVVAAEGPRLRTQAERVLRARARDEGLELADDVRVEVRTEATPSVGATSPTVEVTVTAVATAPGYRPADLRAAAETALRAAAHSGRFLVPGTVAWDHPRPAGGTLAATARARVSAVDTDGVARALRGRRALEAERELEARHGAGSVAVRRMPLPLPLLPFFASRIRVEVVSSSS